MGHAIHHTNLELDAQSTIRMDQGPAHIVSQYSSIPFESD